MLVTTKKGVLIMSEPRKHELGFYIYDEPITVELGSWYNEHTGTDIIYQDVDNPRNIVKILAYVEQRESISMKKWFVSTCDKLAWKYMVGLTEDAERIMSCW